MNTIRELKQQEKYKSMLKRKNKEKKIYKDKNASLQLEKQRLYIALRNKDKEIERLNNIINEINILIKHDYFKARELKEEIQRSNLYQGDYPIAYYHAEWLEDITDIYLNKIQEIRGSDKE